MTPPTPPKPKWRVTRRMRSNARALRHDLTLAERIIWRAVRAHRLNGAGFRRQAPIGPYIVDFISHSATLIIEIDGGQHFEEAYECRDAIRDAFLRSKGFRVLRFNNHDVMTNKEGVLTTIAAVLGEAVAPSLPSPASGGGGTAVPSNEEKEETQSTGLRRQVPSPGISAFTRVFAALCGGGLGRGPAASEAVEAERGS